MTSSLNQRTKVVLWLSGNLISTFRKQIASCRTTVFTNVLMLTPFSKIRKSSRTPLRTWSLHASYHQRLSILWSPHRALRVSNILPKIHKPNNPGRPIVSACCCPTENISAYLDEVMAPFVKQLPTYVKDTNHALSIFNSFTFDESDQRPCFLFTMDVKSLYTVIPNDGGLQALAYFLDQRTVKEPSTHTLVRLVELVLTLNAFSFDNQHYR